MKSYLSIAILGFVTCLGACDESQSNGSLSNDEQSQDATCAADEGETGTKPAGTWQPGQPVLDGAPDADAQTKSNQDSVGDEATKTSPEKAEPSDLSVEPSADEQLVAKVTSDDDAPTLALGGGIPSIPTTKLGALSAAIALAMPSAEEADLRQKCDFDTWAGVGTQQCTCTPAVKIACVTNGETKEQTLSVSGWSKKFCFQDVCKAANDAAKNTILSMAYDFEKACVAGGGQAIQSGGVDYSK